MPKPRSKRQDIREERKRKRQEECRANHAKRQKRNVVDHRPAEPQPVPQPVPEPVQSTGELEFFGMLSEEEQESFRVATQDLENPDLFESPDDRAQFLQGILKGVEGQELKLACSQSCSRILEKLILLSAPAQKKRLFEAFAGHFLTLVQHRFASHCCEMLFMSAAPVVTEEMKMGGGFKIALREEDDEDGNKPEQSMEQLYLLTLDELEADLGFLMSHKFASHSLRVLLLVLTGKAFNDGTNYLLKGKKGVSVANESRELYLELEQERKVPPSFDMAVRKIISDTVAEMDKSSLRVLATHPTGSPTLQLLLKVDIELGIKKNKKAAKSESQSKEDDEAAETGPVLLPRLLPGAPESLKEDTSAATEFVTAMVYDQIGSRVIEVLIDHCPGKIFKALNHHIFAGRIASYVRNEVSAYPAIKVLTRLGKNDLAEYMERLLPVVPTLMEKERYNVIRTLFERCSIRECDAEIAKLRSAVVDACGGDPKSLIPTVCHLRDDEEDKRAPHHVVQKKEATIRHGAQLICTMLETRGPPAKAAQTSLLGLTQDETLRLATMSKHTALIIRTALKKPSLNPLFHKSLAAPLVPHALELAKHDDAYQIISAIIGIPPHFSREVSIPFHLKEALMTRLAADGSLRGTFSGRILWLNLKVEMWKSKREQWTKWAKQLDCNERAQYAATPVTKEEKKHQEKANALKRPSQAQVYAERRIKHAKMKRAWEARGAGESAATTEVDGGETEAVENESA